MMTQDTKTGYNWIWLTPLVFVVLLTSAGVHKMSLLFGKLRSAYVSWRHPEIARMKKLSGIDK